jgi:hypothetical protein
MRECVWECMRECISPHPQHVFRLCSHSKIMVNQADKVLQAERRGHPHEPAEKLFLLVIPAGSRELLQVLVGEQVQRVERWEVTKSV